MTKIPTHRIAEQSRGQMAFSRYASVGEANLPVDYAHRDDYYIFVLIESGRVNILIDFKECEIAENEVFCILPGQVHSPADKIIRAGGWILAVDRMLVRDEYKEIFERMYLMQNRIQPDEDVIDDLKRCIPVIHRRIHSEKHQIEQFVLHDLISSYIGMIAGAYQKGLPVPMNTRPVVITSRFKSLLSENYRTLKRPSSYAEKLNISSSYLNESVKKITGMTAGDWIQNETVLQAKRLLFYTNLSIKEIALQLGYEDWAYFSRLFSKVTKLSPGQFRKMHLKYRD